MNKKNFFYILIAISIIYPAFTVVRTILMGDMPLWFDPARDLLLALENLKKPTLIGPPTGIPGIFYGPYWIWLLSGGMLISKDPRLIIFLLLTLPYFTIFLYVLFRFAPLFNKTFCALFFLLFMITYHDYITQLWSPHLAPLLFLILLYLLVFTDYTALKIINSLKFFLAGFIGGLIVNFHMSFGMAVFFGTVLFFTIEFLRSFFLEKKGKQSTVFLSRVLILFFFIFGFIVPFFPTVIFEYRHGFMQTNSFIKTITDAVFYNTAAVGQVGLNKLWIIQVFIGKFGEVLHISGILMYFMLLLIAKDVILTIKRQIHLTRLEQRLLLLLFTIGFCILILYLSSKNPVWTYHFIGVEIIMLFLIGLVLKKLSPIFNRLFVVWVIVLLLANIYDYSKSFTFDPRRLSSLSTKKYIAERILKDANSQPFSVFAYSPSLYTYDYDYLFRWLGSDIYHNLPSDPSRSSVVYLIVPETSKAIREDFIHYRTNVKDYKTVDEWNIEDGTLIVKRMKLK